MVVYTSCVVDDARLVEFVEEELGSNVASRVHGGVFVQEM